MNTRKDLLAAYAVWRRWTEAEAGAIASANWPLLAECQRAKRMLQPTILQLSQAAAGPAGVAETPEEIRAVLAELIALEKANSEALAAQRAGFQGRQAELSAAERNLARMQRSYRQPLSSAWESYS